MNSRTEGELYDSARRLDPRLSPRDATYRIRGLCDAMTAGAAGYTRERFIEIMAVCEVTIAAIDDAAMLWVALPPPGAGETL